MKRLALALCLLAAPVSAQTVMDGTDAGLDGETVAAMMREITAREPNPYAAQFDRLAATQNGRNSRQYLCGFVNFSNNQGGFEGFVPFYYDIERERGSIWNPTGGLYPPSEVVLRLNAEIFEETGCRAALDLPRSRLLPPIPPPLP